MLWEIKLRVTTARLTTVLETLDLLPASVEYELNKIKDSEPTLTTKWIEPRKAPTPLKDFVKSVPNSGKSMAAKVGNLIHATDYNHIPKSELVKLIKQAGGNPSGLSYYVGNLRSLKILGAYDSETGTYTVK